MHEGVGLLRATATSTASPYKSCGKVVVATQARRSRCSRSCSTGAGATASRTCGCSARRSCASWNRRPPGSARSALPDHRDRRLRRRLAFPSRGGDRPRGRGDPRYPGRQRPTHPPRRGHPAAGQREAGGAGVRPASHLRRPRLGPGGRPDGGRRRAPDHSLPRRVLPAASGGPAPGERPDLSGARTLAFPSSVSTSPGRSPATS